MDTLKMLSFKQFINEGVEEHEKLKDHTKNPFHKILTNYGFIHQSTTHKQNPLAKNNPKADHTDHLYTHSNHGKSHVIVTMDHGKSSAYKNDKMYSWLHRYEQENKIISPSHGDSKPQLAKSLTSHYGEPK